MSGTVVTCPEMPSQSVVTQKQQYTTCLQGRIAATLNQ